MIRVLDVFDGLCWTLCYIAAIILGVKCRTWCIPRLAICFNFSWELLVVMDRIRANAEFNIPYAIQLLWLLLDIGIVIIWLYYDEHNVRRLLENLALFVCSLTLMYLLAYCTGYWEPMAFVINLIMSALFLYRLARDHTNWQSPFIAAAKMIGTLSATLGSGVLNKNPFIVWIGGLCFILDLYYISKLINHKT